MASFDEFFKSLPEDSNKRGEYFEKVFVPWFLKTDPEWSSQVQEVWLWDDYPQRWGKDCGIDLVYEDRQGNHWAVQSKCVSPDREISKAEIDSFLSESSDSKIYGRLLIASTDGIGKNAQQVIDRQEKQVVCFLLEHFRHSAVEFPSTPEDLSTGQRKEKRTPRPHQEEAIRNVVEGFQKEDRGQLLMACGTGKTLTSLWIKEALNAKRTLVLVPSLGLLSQTLREWTATSQQQFNWICVCSDKSVAKQDKTADNLIERVSGLGVPVTSDPKDIKDFLGNENGGVVFSTYQSSELVADSQKNQATPGFDITFADEAHRCTGKISSAFACVLDGERIRSDKRLFMTATPRVLSKQIKKRADDENITLACMDDSSLFGEVFHQLNFSEAIYKELLSDYRVVIVGVDDASVQAKIINREIVQTGDEVEIDTETLANHIALAKAVKDYDLSRMITFHSRVKSAKKFSEDHPLILDWIPEESKSPKSAMTSYVSGEMNARSRNTEINKLRNISEQEVGILANARCLSEGVDVPTLSGIAFFDPKSSQVDIIQALGRAIRKSEDKTHGYIILPVYLGDTSDVEAEILQSRFKNIWNILLALKSQDDSLRDELDQLRLELGKRNSTTIPKNSLIKIIFDLPSKISATFADSLRTILVRETTENWMEMYGQLKQYIEDNGHTKVAQRGSPLGSWISNQRMAKKNGRLQIDRIKLLDDIEFIWDQRENEWQDKFQLLLQYAKENGNTNVPQRNPELGSWVRSQRDAKERDKLPEHRVKLLDKIGFIWNEFEIKWQSKYLELKKYIKDNGDANVPQNHPTLGLWTANQRSGKIDNTLSSQRILLLDEIGFIWNKLDFEWEQNYRQLKEFLKDNKDTNLPKRDSSLEAWMTRQRKARKENKLSEERIKKLCDLDFTWDPLEEEWTSKYNEIKEYLRLNGDLNIPQKHPQLGNWVTVQRRSKFNNNLSIERINLLNDLGFIWNTKELQWNDMLQELKCFIEKNGHANVPKNTPRLGTWALTQRQAKKSGKLSDERTKLLDNLDFVWDPKDQSWHKQYQELELYYKENGNTDVPRSLSKLYTWISNQRKARKGNELSEERIKLLDNVEFVWDQLEKQWWEKYQKLRQYIEEHGNSKVPGKHAELGDWVADQRKAKKNKKISEERIQLLDEIGFIWNQTDQEWKENYDQLKECINENGDIIIPSDNLKLRNWVGKQRQAKKNGKLSKDRIQLLDDAGFVWGAK